MRNFLNRFHKNENGVVAIIVALALAAILFGVLALSIDLNRTQESFGHNHNATDAAALAGAEMWLNAKIDAIGKKPDPLKFNPSAADMKAYVKSIVIKNFAQDQSSATFLDDGTFKVDMTQGRVGLDKTQFAVRVAACATLDTDLAQAAKIRDVAVDGKQRTCTVSTAAFQLGKLENTEVAFALDFTESMYWKGQTQSCPPNNGNPSGCPPFAKTKAAALQNAMSYILDTYFSTPSADATAFASIVPYTGFVNIYPYEDKLVDTSISRIDFDGKKFSMSGYNSSTGKWPANNAWSQYAPFEIIPITNGNNLNSYQYDPDFKKGTSQGSFVPFYTFSPYDGDTQFETMDYSYVLSRIPVIRDSVQLNSIISSSTIPKFDNYQSLVNSVSKENFVFDPKLSALTKWGTTNANEQYAKMMCYQYTVAAALDERVDGPVKTSAYITSLYAGGKRDTELHESFPIQPLTSDNKVLKNVVDRYVANTRFDSTHIPLGSYAADKIIDLQSRPIDKASIISYHQKTSSLTGLMWAWFTLKSDWQDIWDEKNSLHEDYVGGDKKPRDGSIGDKLPSEKNFKNIILISDGYDNDGLDVAALGRKNVCDAYTPIEPVSDDQYNKLCTAIKTNSTADEPKDDINIYTIMLDYDAGAGNRFEKCASPNGYFNNVSPATLRQKLDQIFASILTNAVPVRLIENN